MTCSTVAKQPIADCREINCERQRTPISAHFESHAHRGKANVQLGILSLDLQPEVPAFFCLGIHIHKSRCEKGGCKPPLSILSILRILAAN